MHLFILAKPPQGAKTRLAGRLSPSEREDLAEAMLCDVLTAASKACGLQGYSVVSPDPQLARIAGRHGASFVIEAEPSSLNQAARRALKQARIQGNDAALILPADLPWVRPDDLNAVSQAFHGDAIVACPSIDGGTNALALSPHIDWDFRYGPGSYAAHADAALNMGIRFQPVRLENLTYDLDDEATLRLMQRPQNLSRLGLRTLGCLSRFTDTTRTRSFA
jgi:2-phospho-L-lactate guanylyltransferase